jgi:hypothetical protein
VKIEHRFDTANLLDPGPMVVATVTTRHAQAVGDSVPCTVAQHVSEVIFDYELHSAVWAGAPWAAGPGRQGPGAPEIRNRLGGPREHFSPMWMLVDGAARTDWIVTTEADEATGLPLHGMGGQVGDVLIAIVGPAELLGDVAVTLVQPT